MDGMYEYFQGNWTFNRTIYTDKVAALLATANGSASFENSFADELCVYFNDGADTGKRITHYSATFHLSN